ncbi:MAG: transposase [Chloroflexi bacterium]|nr:transposase [Chloroflexota bacterium]
MVLVGVDWAEALHAACLMQPAGAVDQRLTIPHSAAGLARLREAITTVEPEPAGVPIAVERPDGLVDAGYAVHALNPKEVDRYRERTRVAGRKTDPADAELLARALVTDRDRHQPLRPSSLLPNSLLVEEIRVLARLDERASRDQRRQLNRLRHDLPAVLPAALDAFQGLTAVFSLLCADRPDSFS